MFHSQSSGFPTWSRMSRSWSSPFNSHVAQRHAIRKPYLLGSTNDNGTFLALTSREFVSVLECGALARGFIRRALRYVWTGRFVLIFASVECCGGCRLFL